MTEIVKETTTTPDNIANTAPIAQANTAPVNQDATSFQTVEYLVYFFFGVLEILLAFRLVLKLAGAGVGGAFVGLIYGITGIFILPFEGIFHKAFAPGAETTSVLEPSTLVAIIVYAAVAWGIVKLVRIFSGDRQTA